MKFFWKFWKNCKFLIDFFTIFLKTSSASGGSAPRNRQRGYPPYKPSLGGPRFPPPEKIPAGANGFYPKFQGNHIIYRFPECDLLDGTES